MTTIEVINPATGERIATVPDSTPADVDRIVAIVPWNYPSCIAMWKVAPALAVGCSIVLKPSEMTPLTAMKMAEFAVEAGVPEGVFNVITGYGHTTGEALARHMDVDKISFTGS